jgi:CheY-like chemotaxis protein
MKTILVAEDDPFIMKLVVGLLTRAGFEVLQAANGEEALALLDEHEHLDLVITDNMMPFVDGVTLCREIREHDRHAAVPIMMMSAGRKPEGAQGVFDEYVEKPFAMKPFLDTVARLTQLFGDRA